MSRTNTLYVDVKSNASKHAPLPVRESQHIHAGSNVCLYDYAFLIDACIQKQSIGDIDKIDKYEEWYMTTVSNPCYTWQLGAQNHHVEAAQAYYVGTVANFLDESKLPTSGEKFEGWNYTKYRVSPKINKYLLSGYHNRKLSDLRYMYYDIKRCKVMRGKLGYDIPNSDTYSQWGKIGASEETTIEADDAQFIDRPSSVLPTVKNHHNFRANGKFGIIQFNAERTHLTSGQVQYSTKWKRVNVYNNNTLFKTGWDSQACKQFVYQVWGDFLDEYEYKCKATIEDLYWDVTFPCDYLMQAWNWTPPV